MYNALMEAKGMKNMTEAVRKIIEWFNLYYADGVFLGLAVLSYLYLFVHCKDSRKKFLYPIALMIFCAVNPILYYFVFHRIIYWRLFWMFPDAIIIAYAVTTFLKKCDKVWEKTIVLGVFIVFVIAGGKNVYKNGGFQSVKNWEKVPEKVEIICDLILEQDETPHVILSYDLYSDARQYAPQISMMYGRNADNYLFDIWEEDRNIALTLREDSPDYDLVLEAAQKRGYNFVVVKERQEANKSVLRKYSYQELARAAGYIIYYNDEI